jgi:Icc-related predicted phosphoesterase
MKIVAIADVHNQEPVLPEGDMLVIAGDLTGHGTITQMARFSAWLRKQPHRHKVVIAGNHDFCLQRWREKEESETMLGGDGIVYLRDQAVEIEGLKIYGTPWQPWFYDWAFNLERGAEIAAKWALIPEKLDLLISHGPPRGYGDRTNRGERVGCEDLLAAIELKRPRFTVFGHIHEDPGYWDHQGLSLINCSIGERYSKPVEFDISPMPR